MRLPRHPPAAALGRAVILLMVLLALAAAGGAWWFLAPDTMPAWLVRPILTSTQDGPPLYKWRDDKGRLHVTDTPPKDRPYETVRYDPDTNVVPSGSPNPKH